MLYSEITTYIYRLIENKRFMQVKNFIESLDEEVKKDQFVIVNYANVLYNLNLDRDALSAINEIESWNEDVLPLALYTKARILMGLKKYSEASCLWERLSDLKSYGCKKNRSIHIDSYFYNSLCYRFQRNTTKEVEQIREHISQRTRGIQADFSVNDVERALKLAELNHKYNCREYSFVSSISVLEHRDIEKKLDSYISRKRKERYIQSLILEWPNEMFLKNELATLYFEIEKYQQLIELGETCAKLDPYNHVMLFLLGKAFFVTENYERALFIFRKIVDIDSFFIAYGPFGTGMKDAKRIIRDSKGYMCYCYYNIGDYSNSAALLRTIEQNPMPFVCCDINSKDYFEIKKSLDTL